MKINVKNIEKCQVAISEAEGRATTRCISAERLQGMAESAENGLSSAGIRRDLRVGATFRKAGGTLPNSYRSSGDCTWVEITRFASGWFLTGAYRGYAPKGPYGDVRDSWLTLPVATSHPLNTDANGFAIECDQQDTPEMDLIRSMLKSQGIDADFDVGQRCRETSAKAENKTPRDQVAAESAT